MYGILVALQFLTRLPSPIRQPITLEDLGRSIGWFPVVGATIGGILVTVNILFHWGFHPEVASALTVASLVALTGALHLDGVIDTAGGLTAPGDRAARLATMRDATVGAKGAVAGLAAVFAAYAAVLALPAADRSPALLLAPTFGRTAILLSYHFFPYARRERGFSWALKEGATRGRAGVGLAMAGLVALGTAQLAGVLLLVIAVGSALLVGRLIARRLGGLTGDVHGALCEMAQLATLVAAPIVGGWGLGARGWGLGGGG